MAVNGDKYDSIYTGEQIDNAVGKVIEAETEGGVVSHADLDDYVSSNFIANATVSGGATGNPQVNITKSGNAGQTVLHFEFVNIKGLTGDTGATGATGTTPNLTVNASADNAVGTPGVTVTKSGTLENPIFSFAFTNLKGEKGDTGNDGVSPLVNATATVSNTTGTPGVTVTKSVSGNTTTFNFAFTNIKGEKGDKGDDGVVAARYVKTITSSNWSGSSAPYTYTIPATTHLKGKNCSVQIKDSSTGEVYSTTILIAPSTGNVTIKSNVKIGLIIEIFS